MAMQVINPNPLCATPTWTSALNLCCISSHVSGLVLEVGSNQEQFISRNYIFNLIKLKQIYKVNCFYAFTNAVI